MEFHLVSQDLIAHDLQSNSLPSLIALLIKSFLVVLVLLHLGQVTSE